MEAFKEFKIILRFDLEKDIPEKEFQDSVNNKFQGITSSISKVINDADRGSLGVEEVKFEIL